LALAVLGKDGAHDPVTPRQIERGEVGDSLSGDPRSSARGAASSRTQLTDRSAIVQREWPAATSRPGLRRQNDGFEPHQSGAPHLNRPVIGGNEGERPVPP